jgi:hypothetical protein
MNGRWLVMALLAPVLAWSPVAAQLSGRFYLEKQVYAAGEPVFLYFELTNHGPQDVQITHYDPYAFCAGYQIKLSTDLQPNPRCGIIGFAGSCLGAYTRVTPGKNEVERILLNYEHNLRAPGEYDVEAARSVQYDESNLPASLPLPDSLEVHDQLHFRIAEGLKPDPLETQALVDRLQSRDEAARREAARALASLAPPGLETTLLSFADNAEFRQFAPLAFHNLNTPRSMAALAELLVKSQPGTYEHMESADYLAQSGDPRWFPLLAEVARRNPRIAGYVADAARSGEESAIPLLLELLRSKDKEFTVTNAVSALGFTGARAAVPVLLEVLRNPDTGIAQRAWYSLGQLTHKTVETPEFWPEHPQEQYARWAQWWAGAQHRARIYKASECGDFSPLP